MTEKQNETQESNETQERTFTEEIEIAANEVVDTIKDLIQQGNVRRVIIRKPTDEILLEIPLTASVAVSSVVVVFAPLLAALGAMAALLASVKVQVVRVEDPTDE